MGVLIHNLSSLIDELTCFGQQRKNKQNKLRIQIHGCLWGWQYIFEPILEQHVCHVVYHWEERNKEFLQPFRVWINRPPKTDR